MIVNFKQLELTGDSAAIRSSPSMPGIPLKST